MEIINRLKAWIKENEKSKSEFARYLDISPAYLTMILQGKRKVSPELALKIENATNGRIGRLELLYPVDC